MHLLLFHFSKNDWRVCGLFGHLIAHLSTYGNLFLAIAASRVLCSLIIVVWRLRMAPSCVAVGQLACQ